jgi:Na+/proline symporter
VLPYLIFFLVVVAIFFLIALKNPRDNNHEDFWEAKRRDEFRDGF